MDCQIVSGDDSDKKTWEESANDNLVDDIQTENLNEIVSIRSEESIAAAASSYIDKALKRLNDSAEKNFLATAAIENAHDEKSNLDHRVRNGEITPFQAANGLNPAEPITQRKSIEPSALSCLEQYMKRQAELSAQRKKLKDSESCTIGIEKSRKFEKIEHKLTQNKTKRSVKIEREKNLSLETSNEGQENFEKSSTSKNRTENICGGRKRFFNVESEIQDSGSEYVPSDAELEDSDAEIKKKRKERTKRRKKDTERHLRNFDGRKIFDDGDEAIYQERMEAILQEGSGKKTLFTVDNLFKIQKIVWKKLYEYQRVSVRWLWELHGRGLGGLLGDEMGLGKTVQIIAFLAGLDVSELLSDGGRFRGLGPSLIVCPATLLEQWVKHFRVWAPSLRVVVLHHSGTYRGHPESLIEDILRTGGIIVTSYSGILRHETLLLESQWHYVILDEGHKIRNPDAKISKAVKKFSTPHRLLLTGSPMQNSLKELWSLFDFILPGKLGTLSTFIEHCANPITRGGYANASPLQEATALQVATMLKDAIAPYMLRRTKNDVQHHISLPAKNEQVLFCGLTDEQKKLYKEYLRTDHVSAVLHDRSSSTENSYRARLLVALTNLRKICNHPDLYSYVNLDAESDQDTNSDDEKIENFGCWKRSGKLAVVRSLLKIWRRQGHRVLLFTQGRQMMHILESLAQSENYTYLRLDGTTPMAQRQQTIQKYNNDSSYFIFISTTRVGGLGVNLTGADRVVIYDPDWNPAIDAQARERAWRIGQDKRVTIYRLITAGTVEEKIYHRQIFKLLLSNRILEDPRQRRLFQTSDLTELFNLNEPIDGTTTESDRLFRDCKLKPPETNFLPRNIEAARALASSASKKIDGFANNDDRAGPYIESTNTKDRLSEIIPDKKSRKKREKDNAPESSAIFEGEKVPCLLGRRLARSETNEDQISSCCDDQYVLMKLFSKTKVSSAFEHDAVISNSKSNSEQLDPMHRMARDTARESMNVLRQSRKWCWRPTWDSRRNHI